MLAQLHTIAAVELRDEKGEFTIARNARVVERERKQRTSGEALLVAEVGRTAVLRERRHAGEDSVRLRRVGVLNPKAGSQDGIEIVHRGLVGGR